MEKLRLARWSSLLVIALMLGGPALAQGFGGSTDYGDDPPDDDCQGSSCDGAVCGSVEDKLAICPYTPEGPGGQSYFSIMKECIADDLATQLGPSTLVGLTSTGFVFSGSAPYDAHCAREEVGKVPLVDITLDGDNLKAKIRKVTEAPQGGAIGVYLNDTTDIEVTTKIFNPIPINSQLLSAIQNAGFTAVETASFITVTWDNNLDKGINRVRFWSTDPGITISEVGLAFIWNEDGTHCSP